jgi:hypothetical protein
MAAATRSGSTFGVRAPAEDSDDLRVHGKMHYSQKVQSPHKGGLVQTPRRASIRPTSARRPLEVHERTPRGVWTDPNKTASGRQPELVGSPAHDDNLESLNNRSTRVPALVLPGVPVAKQEKLSVREAASRAAHENRVAVRRALERFDFPNDESLRWEEPPDVMFHSKKALGASADASVSKSARAQEEKEPTREEVAKELGARLDPVHCEANPDKFFGNRNQSEALKLIEVPEELEDLSLVSQAIANAAALRERVSEATQVKGIIGIRRPGYNPLLRKYERRMPKPVAQYLANGRDVTAVYPQDEGTLLLRRILRQAGDQSGAKEKNDDDDDEAGKPQLWNKLAQSVDRLSKPKLRNPGLELKNLQWILRDELRLPHTERNFKDDNTKDLERFQPHRREAELKQRSAQHVKRVQTAYVTARNKGNATREKYVQREQLRQEMIQQKRQEHEMLLQRQEVQKTWLKHLLIFHSAHLMLHAATVQTENDASTKLEWMRYLHTNRKSVEVVRTVQAVREKHEIRAQNEARRMNTLALIRWFFDNRPLVQGQRCKAIQRLLLRIHWRKQMKYIIDAAFVVKQLLICVGHVKNTMFQIRLYKDNIIRVQRLMRRSMIRRDEHLFFILSHVREFTAIAILKEIIYGVTSLFPACSQFTTKREMHVTKHKEIKSILIRTEERKHYESCFPGMPLWIAIALEKLSSELMRIYALEYKVNLKGSTVRKKLYGLVEGAILHDEDCAELTWAIYYDLSNQAMEQWDTFLRQKELRDAREEQNDFIRKALADFAPEMADKAWAEEQKRLNLSKLQRPDWPIGLVTLQKVVHTFQGIMSKSLQAKQAEKSQRDPEGAKPEASTEGEAHAPAQETVLKKHRASIVKRVTERNRHRIADHLPEHLVDPTRDNLADPDSSELPSQAPQKEDDEKVKRKEALARQQRFFCVRANTQSAFKEILVELPCVTGEHCCDRHDHHGHGGGHHTGHHHHHVHHH